MAEADLKKELDKLRQDLAALRGDFTTLSDTAGKTTKETAQEILDAAKEATASAKVKLQEEAEMLLERVRTGSHEVADTVKQTGKAVKQGVEHQVEEKPITAVLTAVGVGFAIGWLMNRRSA